MAYELMNVSETTQSDVLIASVAGLVAGAMSMAAGRPGLSYSLKPGRRQNIVSRNGHKT